jgi:hypothetical protein
MVQHSFRSGPTGLASVIDIYPPKFSRLLIAHFEILDHVIRELSLTRGFNVFGKQVEDSYKLGSLFVIR